MEFVEFRDMLRQRFDALAANATHLFEVEVDKDEMWEKYLDSFKAEYNPIYRERRAYDCSSCRQFIKNIGNVVFIKDNKMTTLWDFQTDSDEFQPVVDALHAYISSKKVTNMFISQEKNIGTAENHEMLPSGDVKTWRHMHVVLADRFVNKTGRTEGDLQGDSRAVREVFKRGLDELKEDAILTILELIASNTLYKGAEFNHTLTEFYSHFKAYHKLTEDEKELYTWEKAATIHISTAKLRGSVIGTLLVDLSEGRDLDGAVKSYEDKTAGPNYMRPKALVTPRMMEEAKKTVVELGYMPSLERRFANLDDLSINNILFANRDVKQQMSGMDVFDSIQANTPINPKKLNRVEEVPVAMFIESILPTVTDIEVLMENRHSKQMVSLITEVNAGAKNMTKWDNPFGWAYTGNMTASLMKERVKSAGGRVDGDLRFSIQWNDMGRDSNDLDAHCIETTGFTIMYQNKGRLSPNKGILDVDIISPVIGQPAVENITYEDRKTMKDGDYVFGVNYFSGRPTEGFRAEIEFDGTMYSFDCKDNNPSGGFVKVATVTLKNGEFTIKEHLSSDVSVKDVWGLKSNQFIPVSLVCYSPNYWNEQQGIGHQHLFFMLKDCVNTEMPNAFYNEFLKSELVAHKRAFELLGAKLRVQDTANQLSGIGFSMTAREDIIVKIKGQTERIIKIKF